MSKLDILVAEKVMGWKLVDWGKCEPSAPYFYDEVKEESTFSASTWNPSTCLDDALLCLERAANGAWWRLHRNNSGSYTVSLGQPKGRKHAKWTACFEKTAPIAMCVCALKAVGVPESLITQAIGE